MFFEMPTWGFVDVPTIKECHITLISKSKYDYQYKINMPYSITYLNWTPIESSTWFGVAP
jgi:hypothetical protein